MELKLLSIINQLIVVLCSNRTFMELKLSICESILQQLFVVLIVPLWN